MGNIEVTGSHAACALFGYGVEIWPFKHKPQSMEHLLRLLELAPKYRKKAMRKIRVIMEKHKVSDVLALNPFISDILAALADEDLYHVVRDEESAGIATLLCEVIEEAENIKLVTGGYVGDCIGDGKTLLVVDCSHALKLPKWVRDLGEKGIEDIFVKYISMLNDNIDSLWVQYLAVSGAEYTGDDDDEDEDDEW